MTTFFTIYLIIGVIVAFLSAFAYYRNVPMKWREYEPYAVFVAITVLWVILIPLAWLDQKAKNGK